MINTVDLDQYNLIDESSMIIDDFSKKFLTLITYAITFNFTCLSLHAVDLSGPAVARSRVLGRFYILISGQSICKTRRFIVFEV